MSVGDDEVGALPLQFAGLGIERNDRAFVTAGSAINDAVLDER